MKVASWSPVDRQSVASTLVEYQANKSVIYERRPDKVFISLIRVFWPDMALISTISLVKKTRIRLIKTLSGTYQDVAHKRLIYQPDTRPVLCLATAQAGCREAAPAVCRGLLARHASTPSVVHTSAQECVAEPPVCAFHLPPWTTSAPLTFIL